MINEWRVNWIIWAKKIKKGIWVINLEKQRGYEEDLRIDLSLIQKIKMERESARDRGRGGGED
jgi:hypothetical protein